MALLVQKNVGIFLSKSVFGYFKNIYIKKVSMATKMITNFKILKYQGKNLKKDSLLIKKNKSRFW